MKPKNKKSEVTKKSAPGAPPVSDLWVAALALLAQGERARGAEAVQAMQAADSQLRQAQAFAVGGAGALGPWANSPDDLARINDALGLGRPMGLDDLVKWIEMDDGPKATVERIEKWILNEQGEKWGADTVGRLKAGEMTADEGAHLATEIRRAIKQANVSKTAGWRKGRARVRAEEEAAKKAEKEAARKKKRPAQKKEQGGT